MQPGWLFRQADLILGPVPDAQIVEKIYSGDLDGRSEVQKMGTGVFVRLGTVDGFKVHLAKADAKKRVDKLAAATEAKSKRRRNIFLSITGAALLAIAVAVVLAGSQLAELLPGKSSDELAYDMISVDAPVISAAKRSSSDELVDYPGLGTPVKKPTQVAAADKPEKAEKPDRPEKTEKPKAATAKPKLNNEGDDPDGMQMAKFDQGAINEVVKKNQRTLFTCLAKVAKPGEMVKVPIEFVIGNNGRVNKVWVDHPDYKQGALPDCLLEKLSKWPFKSYDGEQATVNLSFNIGKKG